MDPMLIKLALGGLAVLGCIGLLFGVGLALAAHKFAVEINPKYALAHVELGRLHAGMDKATEAVEHLQRAVAAGADWPDVHCLLGELMSRINRGRSARRHLERALQLNPDYTRAGEVLASLAA